MRAIVLPDAKPALEWINGRVVQKVSPKRKHALAQTRFASALCSWADATGAGTVGTEWHFHLAPPGEERRPLVPDVAFLSYARLPYAAQIETEIPRIAPDLAIEILSPKDRAADVAEKVRVYIATGSRAVVLVDPESQTVRVIEATQSGHLGGNDFFEHDCLSGFRLRVGTLFMLPQPK